MTAATTFVYVAGHHTFFLASRPSVQDEIDSIVQDVELPETESTDSKEKLNIKAHTLLLPGKCLHVTPLIKRKKWHNYGDKGKVVNTLEELETLGFGVVAVTKGACAQVSKF